MYAELGFEHAGVTALYLYRSREEAEADRAQNVMHVLALTNEDITELVVVQGIKPVCMNP